jgi:hypothetical protein
MGIRAHHAAGVKENGPGGTRGIDENGGIIGAGTGTSDNVFDGYTFRGKPLENEKREGVLPKAAGICAALSHTSRGNQGGTGKSACVSFPALDGHLSIGTRELPQKEDIINGHSAQTEDVEYAGRNARAHVHAFNLSANKPGGQATRLRVALPLTQRRMRHTFAMGVE